MKTFLHGTALASLICSAMAPATAHEYDPAAPHALDHAPIGVMADHRHEKGEWMLSYRFMTMNMAGSRDGTHTLSPDEIATTVPNRFFGNPMQPPTLRVVPTDMTMNMHMIGAMYGLSDRVTIMGMTNYVTKDMDHITYQGGMGTTVLGGFTTETSGFGDSFVTAIIGLDDGSKKTRQINVNLGLSIPTGSITKTDQILTPMNMTPSPRLPYPMQLGTGTFDLMPGVTWTDRQGQMGWGAQASARIPLGDNDEGYQFGDRFEGTAWLAYEPAYWISFSGRLKGITQGQIDGMDPAIVAPVQTADPDNQGGDQITALAGINLVGQSGALRGHRLALEFGLPLHRDLNGPQLETDHTFTIGWQKAF